MQACLTEPIDRRRCRSAVPPARVPYTLGSSMVVFQNPTEPMFWYGLFQLAIQASQTKLRMGFISSVNASTRVEKLCYTTTYEGRSERA